MFNNVFMEYTTYIIRKNSCQRCASIFFFVIFTDKLGAIFCEFRHILRKLPPGKSSTSTLQFVSVTSPDGKNLIKLRDRNSSPRPLRSVCVIITCRFLLTGGALMKDEKGDKGEGVRGPPGPPGKGYDLNDEVTYTAFTK